MWGETTSKFPHQPQIHQFQSTLPVWGETAVFQHVETWKIISIHSPRVGRDDLGNSDIFRSRNFNPLSPCGERHLPKLLAISTCRISIHSPRVGRDKEVDGKKYVKGDFNPLSPCGERPGKAKTWTDSASNFNPLSPCGERQDEDWRVRKAAIFQSTLPVWGETMEETIRMKTQMNISIHSPRVGRDTSKICAFLTLYHFNPLSPCGERPQKCT